MLPQLRARMAASHFPGHRRFSTSIRRLASVPPQNNWEADVAVVGSGMAGMCAAIAAAQNGASVVVLDRAHGGGASALSGGVVYAGGGTKQQVAAGYAEDSAANFLAYMQQEVGDSGVVDAATLKRFCDEAPRRMEWLESLGARFGSSLCPYKTSYPTDRHYLYFSGNEKAARFAAAARPAPRGHRQVGAGLTGQVLWRAMFASARNLGVVFRPATKAEKLVQAGGRVGGVEFRTLAEASPGFARHRKLWLRDNTFSVGLRPVADRYAARASRVFDQHAEPGLLRAKAVVLAAGGFAMNQAMTAQHMPGFRSIAPLGTSGDDGSGILLGQAAGGQTSHLDRYSAWRFLSPPTAFMEGVAVSPAGRRFAPEDLYGATFSDSMIRESAGRGFLIVDARQWAAARRQLPEQSQTPLKQVCGLRMLVSSRKARSLDSLAAKLGVDGPGLQQTVAEYNAAMAEGRSDPMQKSAEACSPIAQAPFYGMDISLYASGLGLVPGLTLGGLRVEGSTGLVLDGRGQGIRGLYAAGRNAVGVCSNSYVSGLSLADCVFSGERAGVHAATTIVAASGSPS